MSVGVLAGGKDTSGVGIPRSGCCGPAFIIIPWPAPGVALAVGAAVAGAAGATEG